MSPIYLLLLLFLPQPRKIGGVGHHAPRALQKSKTGHQRRTLAVPNQPDHGHGAAVISPVETRRILKCQRAAMFLDDLS
jgi:hypothetical protein